MLLSRGFATSTDPLAGGFNGRYSVETSGEGCGFFYFIGIFIANKLKMHISIEVSRKEFSLWRQRFSGVNITVGDGQIND